MNLHQWLRQQWDRVGAWALIALGALVLFMGWLGMSRTAYAAEQLPYILSGGIFGLFLLGLGAMLWLSADLKDEWRKLDRIEAALHGDARRGAWDPAAITATGPAAAPDTPVAPPGEETDNGDEGRPPLAALRRVRP